MRYYIADPHFFHGALNTKMDRRGFESVEAMNEYMLRQWNRKVRKNDEVVILGDLSWGKAETITQAGLCGSSPMRNCRTIRER